MDSIPACKSVVKNWSNVESETKDEKKQLTVDLMHVDRVVGHAEPSASSNGIQ